jgi:Ca-activated chloride channel family protein
MRLIKGRRLNTAIAAILLCLLAQVPGGAQERAGQPALAVQDEGELSLSSNLVSSTVVVRDAAGAFVTDLTAQDFVVYEDGVRQQVDQLYRQGEVPLRLALLFDASMSIKSRLDFERRAASRFFTEVVKSNDQAALYSVSTDWQLIQPFTNSSETLIAAANRLEAKGTTSLYGAIQAASKELAKTEGRRVILILSDGYDTANRETLAQTLEVAQRSDVVIYGISPAGSGQATSSAAVAGAGALRQLCDQTGGVAFFPPVMPKEWQEAQELNTIYTRLVDELRAQYVLTYYSNAPATDGRFRSLRVEVKRPGLTVSARKGYYAA